MKEGWEYKKLGEVCEILDSQRKPITKGKREPGAIPYYGATGCLDYVKDYIFDEKLVLLGEDGAKWGAGDNSAYIINGKSWVNNHAHALRPKRDLLIDELLVYYLNFSNLLPYITGVTVPKALNEAKALFQASLKEMLEPKEGWEEKTLKELGQTQTGTTPSKSDKDNYGDYIPFIRPSEIDYDGSGRIEYNSALKLSKKGADNGRVFDAQSIYMVCIGATIGKVGYGERTISCNQQINILTPNSSVNYKFAYYAMKNDGFQQKVIKEGTSSQATLPIINKGKWEKLSISYPPISEQQSIVETLDSLKSKVDRLQENYAKISQECAALKQAILRKVFE